MEDRETLATGERVVVGIERVVVCPEKKAEIDFWAYAFSIRLEGILVPKKAISDSIH